MILFFNFGKWSMDDDSDYFSFCLGEEDFSQITGIPRVGDIIEIPDVRSLFRKRNIGEKFRISSLTWGNTYRNSTTEHPECIPCGKITYELERI